MNKVIVTSTIATNYGIGDRLNETLRTIESVRKHLDAEIYFIDSSIPDWDENPVRDVVDVFARVRDNKVRNILESGYGMSFVKSATEVHLTQVALELIGTTKDRIYKLSGRYKLNDEFVPHEGVNFTFLRPMVTGLKFDTVQTNMMLMTRLYSFAPELRLYYQKVLKSVENYVWDVHKNGHVTDIEHGLYKFIDKDLCEFVGTMGVEGRIGHLTTEIRE